MCGFPRNSVCCHVFLVDLQLSLQSLPWESIGCEVFMDFHSVCLWCRRKLIAQAIFPHSVSYSSSNTCERILLRCPTEVPSLIAINHWTGTPQKRRRWKEKASKRVREREGKREREGQGGGEGRNGEQRQETYFTFTPWDETQGNSPWLSNHLCNGERKSVRASERSPDSELFWSSF